MSCEFGTRVKLSIFGESHSEAVGAVLNGIPAGERLDLERIRSFLQRRAPGSNELSTTRREADEPIILSGVVDGVTTGTPIAFEVKNTDCRESDYSLFRDTPRPSHADYPALVKYGTAHDIRGGGNFSGRLTIPLCFAGAVCMEVLRRHRITIGAHILSVGEQCDTAFDAVNISPNELKSISAKPLAVVDDDAGERMRAEILTARDEGDSVGGTVECCIIGLPTGIGEPMFDGIENKISQAIFAIPAVKGIEFGDGFASSRVRGSQNNDEYFYENDTLKIKTNHSGGILGGLSTGMPVIFRAAFKPTPSIAKTQHSVSLSEKKNVPLSVAGRHDPCIVPRAVPCVEAAAALAVLDLAVFSQLLNK